MSPEAIAANSKNIRAHHPNRKRAVTRLSEACYQALHLAWEQSKEPKNSNLHEHQAEYARILHFILMLSALWIVNCTNKNRKKGERSLNEQRKR
jgi:hypothetical protein